VSFSTVDLHVAILADHPQAETITVADWCQWFQQWGQQVELAGSPLNTYELTLKLTTDAEIQALNRSFRQIDQPTDVLSFAALETDYPVVEAALEEEPLYLGDIVISLDTAARQATRGDYALSHELAWLAAHGFLHLLGWDHPDDVSLERMLTKQCSLLSSLGMSPPAGFSPACSS
jgi:probable rRNA maturation factor